MLLALLVPSHPAFSGPDERMSGTVPVAEKKKEDKKEAEKEEEPEKKKRPAVLDVQLATLESLGILHSFKDGGMGKDVWAGTRWTFLEDILDGQNLESRSPAQNRLLLRALTTAHDVRLIEHDKNPEPGADFLTLRLEQLLELGAYADALELYSASEQEAYHPRLARAGILAMLAMGSSSLACLETRTFEDRFEGKSFWDNVSAYCDHLLEDRKESVNDDSPELAKVIQDKDYTFAFDPEKIQTLSTLDRVVLFAQSRIDYGTLSQNDVESLPADILGLMANDPELAQEWKFRVAEERVRRGLAKPDTLASLYTEGTVPDIDFNEQEALSGLSDWQRFALLYRAAKNANTEKDIRAVMAIAMHQPGSCYAYAPFTPFLQKISPPDATDVKAVSKAVTIFLCSGEKVPRNWGKAIDDLIETEEQSVDLRLLSLAAEIHKSSPEIYEAVSAVLPKLDTHGRQSLHIIERVLDKDTDLPDNPATIYEKPLGLTFSKDYVMPSSALPDRLRQAREDKILGEVVLLSVAVTKHTPTHELYPGLVGEVLNSQMSVGLTNEARSLAIEAVLGLRDDVK